MIRHTLLIAILLFLAYAPDVYAAGDVWTVRCSEVESRQECEMFQRLTLVQTGERVVEMAFGFPPHKPEGRGAIVLPLGVLLTEGARLKIDEHMPYKFEIRYCTTEGCFAFIGLNDSFINQMKKGSQAILSFKTIGGQPVDVALSLMGFTKAYDNIAP